jgi:hypothetical protein
MPTSSSAHVEEALFRDKIRLRSALFSSIAFWFTSASFFISSISLYVLSSFSSASSLLFFLSYSISPCTAALASAASRSRSSLSFNAAELEDAAGLMPTFFRKVFELFLGSA